MLQAWADAPWIGWGERLSATPPARWLAERAPAVEPVVRSDSLRVQIAVVESGGGVALMPQPSVAYYRLVPVRLGARLREEAAVWPVDELFLVTHRALRNVPRVWAVWDVLLARVADRSTLRTGGPVSGKAGPRGSRAPGPSSPRST